MNIVKFKDIILTEENAPELTQEQRDIFNENFKGKYAYCVNWQYCVPLEKMSQSQYVQLSKDLCERFVAEIKWYCDGKLLKTDELDYGVLPVYIGETPTRESDVKFDYVFYGWSPEIVPAVENAEYNAVFEEILRQYEIRFFHPDDDEPKQYYELDYGVLPEWQGENPTKESEEHYDYEFRGWIPEIHTVDGDCDYMANFEQIPHQYTINWLLEDGTEIIPGGITQSYGVSTEIPELPEIEGKEFVRFVPEVQETVEGPATYTAIYKQIVEKFNVVWKDYEGNTIRTDIVEIGDETPDAPTAPEVEGMLFDRWNPSIQEYVYSDIEYNAIYVEVHNVVWNYKNENFEDISIETKVVDNSYPEIPSISDIVWDNENMMKFTGWINENGEEVNPEEEIITEDKEYTAVYEHVDLYRVVKFESDINENRDYVFVYGKDDEFSDISVSQDWGTNKTGGYLTIANIQLDGSGINEFDAFDPQEGEKFTLYPIKLEYAGTVSEEDTRKLYYICIEREDSRIYFGLNGTSNSFYSKNIYSDISSIPESEVDKYKWLISLESIDDIKYNAIISNFVNNSYTIQYNISSPRFTSYSSTQKPISIFYHVQKEQQEGNRTLQKGLRSLKSSSTVSKAPKIVRITKPNYEELDRELENEETQVVNER